MRKKYYRELIKLAMKDEPPVTKSFFALMISVVLLISGRRWDKLLQFQQKILRHATKDSVQQNKVKASQGLSAL